MSRRMHAKFETGVRLLPIYKNCSRLNGPFRLGGYFEWEELDKHSCFLKNTLSALVSKLGKKTETVCKIPLKRP